MIGPFDVPEAFVWQDPRDLQGRGGSPTFRLSRRYDGASVLLHEIPADDAKRIDRIGCYSRIPDYCRPFVTPLLGMVQLSGRSFILEAVPPSVPLIAAWRTVVKETPQLANRMLLEAINQIDGLLRQLSERREPHGAVCADNVILTTHGSYGLLAARLRTAGEDTWIRRPDLPSGAPWNGPPASIESIVPVLRDLLATDDSTGAVPRSSDPGLATTRVDDCWANV